MQTHGKEWIFTICKHTAKTRRDRAVWLAVWVDTCPVTLPCASLCRVSQRAFTVCYFRFFTVCFSLPCAAHGKDRHCRVSDIQHTATTCSPVVIVYIVNTCLGQQHIAKDPNFSHHTALQMQNIFMTQATILQIELWCPDQLFWSSCNSSLLISPTVAYNNFVQLAISYNINEQYTGVYKFPATNYSKI